MVNLVVNVSEDGHEIISQIRKEIHLQHEANDVFVEDDFLIHEQNDTDITDDYITDLNNWYESNWYSVYEFVVPILKAVNTLGAIISCIIIIYAIYRFKKLRTRLNMYILQYAIYFLLYTMVTSALESFYHFIYSRFYNLTFSCFMYDIKHTALFLSLMFISALGFEWYLISFKPVALERFNFLFKHPMLIIYFIGSVKIVLKVINCYNDSYSWARHTNFLEGYYPIALIGVILLNILKYRCRVPYYNEKISYALLINTVVVLSVVPNYFHDIIYDWSRFRTLDRIMEYISFIPTLLLEGNPILVCWIFSRTNKNFQYALDIFLRPSMKGYGQELLDNNSEDLDVQNNDVPNATSTYINTQNVDYEIETEEQVIVNI